LRFGKSRIPAVCDSTAGGLSCRERERGLALVEFALVVPFLLILIVGIIDFGFLFNDVISVRQGARDGGRQASVGSFGSDSSCPLYGASALPGAKALMCLTKDRDNVADEKTRVRIIVGDGSSTTAYKVGNPITICVQYQMRSLTGVLPVLNGRVFTTRTVFRIETVSGLPLVLESGSGIEVASEESLPARSWTCLPP
jgi:Flp pilus assembly protein TadG